MKQIIIYLLMVQKLLILKQKILKIAVYPLCLVNISKDWLVDNIKRNGLKGYVYGFRVDYDDTPVSDILDILKYLMKNNNMFGFIKKVFLVEISFFSGITPSINSLKCVSMNNQECKVIP